MSLSSDIKTGERLIMDIENPEDIALLVGGEPYVIDSYYPIHGKYLSISRQRAWGMKET